MPYDGPEPFHFTAAHWAAVWAHPHPELAARAVTPDVVGRRPGAGGVAHGVTAYKRWVAVLLARVPDLRLEALEHAGNGEVLFVRWTAYGTGRDGLPFELDGVDRLRLRDGLIKEHLVYYDPTLVDALAGPPGAPGDDRPGT